jgi:hypothetical protein
LLTQASRAIRRCFPRVLFTGVTIATAVHPVATTRTVDFQSPALGSLPKRIINPFVAKGVTFLALPPSDNRFTDPVVGLVKNTETSACVAAPDTSQRLGTGREALPLGGIGGGGFAIKALFDKEVEPVTLVSVEFQTLAGNEVDLHLFDANNIEVGSAQALANPPDSSCDRPGKPRARVTVTATSRATVAYAIMEVPPRGSYVFVIDRFRFGRAPEESR